MLLGILSDTHDNLPKIRGALAFFAEKQVGALIHAGDFIAPFALKEILKFDGPVYAVFGNNDGEHEGLQKLLPDLGGQPLRLDLDGRIIGVAHDRKKLTKADKTGLDVLVVGHTHRAEISACDPLLLNPGECGAWTTGASTVITLDTETLEAQIHEI